MKKFLSLILLITLIVTALACTSCGTQEDSEGSLYDDIIVFIYGESDSTDFFLNFEFFSTTKAAAQGFKNTWDISSSAISSLWNKLVDWVVRAWNVIVEFVAAYWLYILIVIIVGFIVTFFLGAEVFSYYVAIIITAPLWVFFFLFFAASFVLLIGVFLFTFIFVFLLIYFTWAVVIDLYLLVMLAYSMIIVLFCRLAVYVLIDCGWGVWLLKNINKFI